MIPIHLILLQLFKYQCGCAEQTSAIEGERNQECDVALGLCALSSFDLNLSAAVPRNNTHVQTISAQQRRPQISPLFTVFRKVRACLEKGRELLSALVDNGSSSSGRSSEVESSVHPSSSDGCPGITESSASPACRGEPLEFSKRFLLRAASFFCRRSSQDNPITPNIWMIFRITSISSRYCIEWLLGGVSGVR